MNDLQTAFARATSTGHKALLPFITAGCPDIDTTLAILRRIDPSHCACAEIGFPFTDPIADGPVIQTSFTRALAGGFTTDAFLPALGAARPDIRVPLVAMVSYSIVYRRGVKAFMAALRTAGVDGVIIPDLALEEAGDVADVARATQCSLIMIATPTSTADRRARIAELSDPFIYYQSLAGVTGERRALSADLATQVADLRTLTDKPICVGFGISTADHVREVCAVADGAIVGSALVRHVLDGIDAGAPPGASVERVIARIGDLATGLPTVE
jgi:tryptophan synthase alpha chain